MEAILPIPSSTTFAGPNSSRTFSLTSSSTLQFKSLPTNMCKRVVVVAGAKNNRQRNKNKNGTNAKPNTHSFTVKPDEITGPFPEAILLRKKSVQEDGRLMPEFADADEEKLFEFLTLQMESNLNVERMRHYEVVYLIHENNMDDVESIVSKVQDFVRERKGRIYRLNNWGLRRLAYKIKKANKANYILMNFEMEAKCINDFKTMLDKDERIIRHLVMKRDEAITEDCPPPPEFHTLQEGEIDDEFDDDDDYEDEDEDEDEDMDDELELEMAGNDDDYEDENIIIVDDDDVDVAGPRGGESIGGKEMKNVIAK